MLICQLKTLTDKFFGSLTSKLRFLRSKIVSFRIRGFHGYCHVMSISEKMVGDINEEPVPTGIPESPIYWSFLKY